MNKIASRGALGRFEKSGGAKSAFVVGLAKMEGAEAPGPGDGSVREMRHVSINQAITYDLDKVVDSARRLLLDIRADGYGTDEDKPNDPIPSLGIFLEEGADMIRRRCSQLDALLNEIRAIIF